MDNTKKNYLSTKQQRQRTILGELQLVEMGVDSKNGICLSLGNVSETGPLYAEIKA